jgi:hypothetical protein
MEFIMSTKVNVFITPLNDNKYVCIANNEPIAKSNDATYFERHYSTNSVDPVGVSLPTMISFVHRFGYEYP